MAEILPGYGAAPFSRYTRPMSEHDQVTSDIRILGGNPTAVDVAATTAVLTAALEELAEENGRVSASGPSAWERSQRPFRTPVTRGSGAWRGFSG